MAPWSPFLPDKLWRGLTAGMKEQSSVHLTDWPSAGQVDRTLLMQMAQTRSLIALALAQRAEAGVKVRQPLSNLAVTAPQALSPELVTLIADEVNVKSVNATKGDLAVTLDLTVTPELKAEGIMRDVVRHVQNVRKEVGLEVSDRIVLTLLTDSESLSRAIDVHAATIKIETLAEKLQTSGVRDSVPVRVDGSELYIGVSKA
jgi:isoleucyl-tRNA synthetase